jgi:hypothetical protein
MVEVIGRAPVLGIVIGTGLRSVADQVNVPMTTARGWRRRYGVRAPMLTAAIVAIAVRLDPTAVLLEGDGETIAMQALGAVWQRARRRFGERIPRLCCVERSTPTPAGISAWTTPRWRQDRCSSRGRDC